MIMARSFQSIYKYVGLLAQLPCWISTESDRSRQFPNEPEGELLRNRGGQNPLALADFGNVVT
jgi:hypothetical protein